MPYKPPSHQASTNSAAGQREIMQASAKRPLADMTPPANLDAKQREAWQAVVEMREPSEWCRADRPLLLAYVRAWTDIETMSDELQREGMVLQGRREPIVNPRLRAMTMRFAHMATLFVRLGMQLRIPSLANEHVAAGVRTSKEKTEALRMAMNEDDEGLLARLQ